MERYLPSVDLIIYYFSLFIIFASLQFLRLKKTTLPSGKSSETVWARWFLLLFCFLPDIHNREVMKLLLEEKIKRYLTSVDLIIYYFCIVTILP